jgi:hypothetical protein
MHGRSWGTLGGGLGRYSLAVLLAILCAEGVLQCIPPPRGHGEGVMTHAVPQWGWDFIPNESYELQRYTLQSYRFDAYGNRVRSLRELPDPSQPTILFSGESVLMGLDVGFDDSVPALVGRELGIQTVNLGVPGHGNDQAYLKLLDNLPRFKRPVAVVSDVLPIQVRRNINGKYHSVFALGPRGELVPTPMYPDFVRSLRLLDVFERVVPFTFHDPMPVTRAVLVATARAARERGAYPLFVFVRHLRRKGGADSDGWIIDELLAQPGLDYIVVDLDPAWTVPGDPDHPSPAGTRIMAQQIARALQGKVALQEHAATRQSGQVTTAD